MLNPIYLSAKIALFLIFAMFFIFSPIRRNTFFGVTIPKEYAQDAILLKILKRYRLFLTLLSVIFVVIMLISDIYATQTIASIVTIAAILLMFAVSIVFYSISRKAILKLRNLNGWQMPEISDLTPIDTDWSEHKLCPSIWWFAPHIAVMLFTAWLMYYFYPAMPGLLAISVDWKGGAILMLTKTYQVALIPVFCQLIFTLLCAAVFRSIKNANLKVSPAAPRKSVAYNRKIRYLWTAYMIIIAFLMDIMFATVGQFLFITLNLRYLVMYVMLGTAILILVGAVVLAWYGRRMRI